ncbi:hypothetical protein K438DRAFT_1867019 [Mycena galopus ATCC 62051]|nr:hypothetical protein K438DRAFT_1867019 [Mycena galopus ATCC 62051]
MQPLLSHREVCGRAGAAQGAARAALSLATPIWLHVRRPCADWGSVGAAATARAGDTTCTRGHRRAAARCAQAIWLHVRRPRAGWGSVGAAATARAGDMMCARGHCGAAARWAHRFCIPGPRRCTEEPTSSLLAWDAAALSHFLRYGHAEVTLQGHDAARVLQVYLRGRPAHCGQRGSTQPHRRYGMAQTMTAQQGAAQGPCGAAHLSEVVPMASGRLNTHKE